MVARGALPHPIPYSPSRADRRAFLLLSVLLALFQTAVVPQAKSTLTENELYEDAMSAYLSGEIDSALDKIDELDRELKEAHANGTHDPLHPERSARQAVLRVRSRYLHFLVLASKSHARAAGMVAGLVQGVVEVGDSTSIKPQAALSGGVVSLSRELLDRVQAVDTILSPLHDPTLIAVSSSSYPSTSRQVGAARLKASELSNGRVAILIPTHPPYYSYAAQFLDSCQEFDCNSATDIWFIFTNEHERALFESDSAMGQYRERGLWHAMVCGDRCLGGGCEPNTKKFVGLRYLTDMIAAGSVYPYRYAVCFDSETIFVRDPSNLPAAIARSDEARNYYHTYHREDLETTVFPAYALLRWNRQHPGREHLRRQTKDYHLHGWWSDLPFFDMSKITDFFSTFVGRHLQIQKQNLTDAVISATIELGNWAFEHNVYKYYNILAHNYTITSLNDALPFIQVQEDKRSWLEVFNLYVGNKTDHLHALLDYTKVLWCAACVRSEHVAGHEIYFQFHGDKKTSCIDGYFPAAEGG